MIVLDASVVVKWFLDEEGSTEALQYEAHHVDGRDRVVAPDLLVYEIANVLSYKKHLTDREIEGALNILEGLHLQLFSFSASELKDVVRVARKRGITVYDALYAMLAQKLGCAFVTADQELYRKLKGIQEVSLLTN